MSNFSNALALQTTRLAAASSLVAPVDNAAAQHALEAAAKVNAFLEPYAKRAHRIKGFTSLHPAFFHQLFSTLTALEYGASLARSRGDGRLATTVDRVRSIGTGFGKVVPQIERFLDLEDLDIDHTVIKKRSLTALFPRMEGLQRSGDVFSHLIEYLAERREVIRLHEESGKKISKKTRRDMLIYNKWDEARIVEYSIEYLSRAFAIAMPEDSRHRLVTEGPQGFSLKQALDTLQFAPAA